MAILCQGSGSQNGEKVPPHKKHTKEKYNHQSNPAPPHKKKKTCFIVFNGRITLPRHRKKIKSNQSN